MYLKNFFLARQKLKQGPFLESSDLMNPIDLLVVIKRYNDFVVIYLTISDEKKLYFLPKEKVTKKIIKNKSIKNK